jgi:hypothetical protein
MENKQFQNIKEKKTRNLKKSNKKDPETNISKKSNGNLLHHPHHPHLLLLFRLLEKTKLKMSKKPFDSFAK